MRKLFVCSLLLASLPAIAGVYRWTDDKGVVHYSDSPPAPNAAPAELPKLQTFDSKALAKGVAVDNSSSSSAPAVNQPPPTAAGSGSRPVITSPANEDTLRDTSGQVTVTVTAADAASLVYYLDGVAQNSPATPSTSYLIENVERGTHTLEVASVGPNGKELSRSAKVTIYYMPPTTQMTKKNVNPPPPPKGH